MAKHIVTEAALFFLLGLEELLISSLLYALNAKILKPELLL